MAHFDQFLAKIAKMAKIIKKVLGKFFSRLRALTNCKVSEKNNERFPRKSEAYERTYVRTRLLRSQTTVGRETNKLILLQNKTNRLAGEKEIVKIQT